MTTAAEPRGARAGVPGDAAADDDLEFVSEEGAAPDPPAWLLLAIFTVIAVALTFPNLSRIRTFIPGDSGDALLNLWILRAVQFGIPHGWHALWSPPIFHPASNTLAYSDTLLPVALLHWPLRLLFGDATAFNLIGLASYVLASWCTFRVARRFVRHWGAAFVAALIYTYASVRLVHQYHFQLVTGGALVPLVLLCVLRVLERPVPRRGIALGFAFAAATLTASYFGAMLGIVLAIVFGGSIWLEPREKRRALLVAIGTALGVIVVMVVPQSLHYLQLQQHSEFRRGFEPASAAHISDFISAAPGSKLLDHIPVISSHSGRFTPGVENRLFPGLVAIVFGIAGIVIVALELRRRGLRRMPHRVLLLVGVAGAVCLVLAFGDWFLVDGRRFFLPFIVFRHLVPGFAGIRAVARFTTGAELAAALFAAVGIDALLAHGKRGARLAITVALAAVVIAECSVNLAFVRVPTTKDDGGVRSSLEARPKGVVLELPISSAAHAPWPFVETPRQLLAINDGYPRVNGYSGFQPKGFDQEVAMLSAFPAPNALYEARRLGVRYVVLRTQLVGSLAPAGLNAVIGKDGVGRFTPATARGIIAGLGPAAARVTPLPGGYLVELSSS